jgi:hypothetical protein
MRDRLTGKILIPDPSLLSPDFNTKDVKDARRMHEEAKYATFAAPV